MSALVFRRPAADPVEAAADENFYQLLKVSAGKKLQEVKYPVYTELEKVLARRTSDESGDYTVTPFNLQQTTHQGITGTTANSAYPPLVAEPTIPALSQYSL